MVSSLLPQSTPGLRRVEQETPLEEGVLGRAQVSPDCPALGWRRRGASRSGPERKREAEEGTSYLLPMPPATSLALLGHRGWWVPTCLAKAAMSSLKESEEQTSPPGGVPSPVPAPSRGEHVANSHFSKTRASSGKSGWLGEAGGERVHEGLAGVGWGWEVWCNQEVDRRPRGKRWRDRRRRRETYPERQRNGVGGRIPRALSLVPLTHRSHLSPFSGRHCPSPGAGEAGGGHRARGLSVPRTLPPRSQPGLRCCPRCQGSGAAHRTGGEVRGEAPGRCQHNKKLPYPLTQEMPPPCPATCPPVCIELSGWDRRPHPQAFTWTHGL